MAIVNSKKSNSINSRLSIKSGNPNINEGSNGDLSFYMTNEGLNLFGKAFNQWYKIGNSSVIGHKGRVNKPNSTLLTGKETKITKDTGKFCMFESGIVKYTDRITLDPSGDLTVKPIDDFIITLPNDDGKVYIDKNITTELQGTEYGIQLDWDSTKGAVATYTLSNIGCDIDMNIQPDAAAVFGLYNYGYKCTLLGNTNGVSLQYGGYFDVSGADSNFGLYLDIEDGGHDIRCVSSADSGDYFEIGTTTHGATTLSTVDDNATAAHLTLDVDGDLVLDPATGITKFYLAGDTDDLCTLTVAANGATTIATVDSDGAAGHLTLDPDGDLLLSGCDVKMDSTKKLYLDGGGDTHIKEVIADSLGITVGGDYVMTLSEYGDDGNEVLFKTSCATFTRQEATFSATGVIASGGTDDTDIDFRHSNKYRLEMTGDITTINLIFPKGSGNFTLVCTTNGDHDVTNWKVWEHDESAGTTTDVMWAGGSVPAFTNNGVDIVSFYRDSTDQQCYGVASLAFATP